MRAVPAAGQRVGRSGDNLWINRTGPWGPEGYDPPDMAWWLWDGAAEGKG